MSLIPAIPTLETERLILRAPVLDDFPAIRAFSLSQRAAFIVSDTSENAIWRGFLSSLGHWHIRGFGYFMATLHDGTPVGRAGLVHHLVGWDEPELGWHVFDGHEGRGLAFEAARAVRDWAARARGLDRLISYVHPDNARSAALAARLGAEVEREDTLLGDPVIVYRHPSVREDAA